MSKWHVIWDESARRPSRLAELRAFRKLLAANLTDLQGPVVICGTGGTGKSTLARIMAQPDPIIREAAGCVTLDVGAAVAAAAAESIPPFERVSMEWGRAWSGGSTSAALQAAGLADTEIGRRHEYIRLLRSMLRRVSRSIHRLLRCQAQRRPRPESVVLQIAYYLNHGCHPPAEGRLRADFLPGRLPT